jgi:hypothetical protein
MNGKRGRRQLSTEPKTEVLLQHLAGKEAVFDLADELQVQPSQIHL